MKIRILIHSCTLHKVHNVRLEKTAVSGLQFSHRLLDQFSRFDTVHVCARQTDGHDVPRIDTSRGKKKSLVGRRGGREERRWNERRRFQAAARRNGDEEGK